MKNKNITKKRWLYLFLGTVVLLFTGIIYAWSILKTPLENEFGWSTAEMAMNYTLTMVFVAVGNLSAGFLYQKLHFRVLMIGSGFMIALGFLLTSTLKGGNIITLYFSYALLCGIGIGTFLVTVVSTVGDWFPDLKGICSGTLQFGFGCSSLIFGYLASYLIVLPDFGWRKTFLLFAILIGISTFTISLFIKRPSENTPLPEAKLTSNKIIQLDIPTKQMIKRKGFWQYFFFCMLISSVGTTMIGFITNFFLSLKVANGIAVFMVGLVSVSNGIGRFSGGVIFDKTKRSTVMFITAIIAFLSPLLLIIGTLKISILLCAVGACLAGISFGFIPSASGSIIRDSYGSTYFASNFSISLTSAIPSAFMAAIAGRILTDGGSYLTIFIILLSLSFLALILCIFMKNP